MPTLLCTLQTLLILICEVCKRYADSIVHFADAVRSNSNLVDMILI